VTLKLSSKTVKVRVVSALAPCGMTRIGIPVDAISGIAVALKLMLLTFVRRAISQSYLLI
jgi:hypothetical protein